ncbi:MAG: hypothetical protein LIO94_01380 [Clostridiales bacterium]|nr:hypothetical protein [Clostridiales bacterium]
MQNKKVQKEYTDDGRTIADMSGVGRPGMFGHLPERRRSHESEADAEDEDTAEPKQPPFTRRERRMYTFAAMKAGLLIGLVYLLVCCALIGFLYLIWMVL